MTIHGVAAVTGTLCVIAWTYLLAAHGHFWLVRKFQACVEPLAETGVIAAVIPARNEADVIHTAVTSLLQQSCAEAIRIFVVDDSSTDGTARVARQAALSGSRSNAVTLIPGQPLPAGWTGKLWAMQQGIERALALQPEFLLLTDADIQHSPESVATLAAVAEHGQLDLASFMVKLHCRSAAEKLLLPAFVFFFFMLYPPPWIAGSRQRTAGAAGGCILIRPEALARAGGVAAIRNQVIDDCALARAVKRTGGKVWLGVTADTYSLRAYGSFAAIERMIARTAFNQLRHSAWLLMGTIAGLSLVYLLPVVLLVSKSWPLGVAAYVLMVVAYLPMVRFYDLSAPWALTLPISAAFYMWATIHSAVKYWSGRGGEWKERTQDVILSR